MQSSAKGFVDQMTDLWGYETPTRIQDVDGDMTMQVRVGNPMRMKYNLPSSDHTLRHCQSWIWPEHRVGKRR